MSPGLIAGAMMLTSGAAHATVNAIFKSGGDKMASRALIDGFSALLVLPFAFILPLPTQAWPWLAGSAATHLIYLFALIRAFESADMMAAYPVLRGVAPVLAGLGAVALFSEKASLADAAGAGLVTAGVMTGALGRHLSRKALAWSLLTGLTIAVYTVIDAQGVRAAPSAPSYIVWSFIVLGVGVGGLFAMWGGPVFVMAARDQWRPGLAAGALSIVSWGLALWALRLGATPRLAALRETSILFGVAIAAVFLHERLTATRLAGAGLILAGAVTLLGLG